MINRQNTRYADCIAGIFLAVPKCRGIGAVFVQPGQRLDRTGLVLNIGKTEPAVTGAEN